MSKAQLHRVSLTLGEKVKSQLNKSSKVAGMTTATIIMKMITPHIAQLSTALAWMGHLEDTKDERRLSFAKKYFVDAIAEEGIMEFIKKLDPDYYYATIQESEAANA